MATITDEDLCEVCETSLVDENGFSRCPHCSAAFCPICMEKIRASTNHCPECGRSPR